MLLSFFFLMIRRPPRSTLFPTRRSSDLSLQEGGRAARGPGGVRVTGRRPHGHRHRRRRDRSTGAPSRGRSEEHTSELQSRQYLVCRLLLEKKKKRSRGVPHRSTKERLL